jgi:hypothetical protein
MRLLSLERARSKVRLAIAQAVGVIGLAALPAIPDGHAGGAIPHRDRGPHHRAGGRIDHRNSVGANICDVGVSPVRGDRDPTGVFAHGDRPHHRAGGRIDH